MLERPRHHHGVRHTDVLPTPYDGPAQAHDAEHSHPAHLHSAVPAVVLSPGHSVARGAARVHRIHRLCAARFPVYVGGPPTVSRLGLTLMEPSQAQVAAGQTWVRCDAIETPSFNTAVGVPRRGSLRGVIGERVPVALRGCSDHWPKVDQAVHFTSCRRSHQAELARSLGGPDAPYPGRERSRLASKAFCAAVFQRYVASTTHFYYYYPTPRSWAAGPHTTTYWAVDPTGDGLPAL